MVIVRDTYSLLVSTGNAVIGAVIISQSLARTPLIAKV